MEYSERGERVVEYSERGERVLEYSERGRGARSGVLGARGASQIVWAAAIMRSQFGGPEQRRECWLLTAGEIVPWPD